MRSYDPGYHKELYCNIGPDIQTNARYDVYLNGDAKKACEEARIRSEIVFTQVFDSHGDYNSFQNLFSVLLIINLNVQKILLKYSLILI